MGAINQKQANWIADVLEEGHTHYEMQESLFRNFFYKNGVFVEERSDRNERQMRCREYSREEFVQQVMASSRQRFSRFLDFAQ
jgi:hypothetical protein